VRAFLLILSIMKTCIFPVPSRALVTFRVSALSMAAFVAFPGLAQTQLKETVVTATRVAQPLSDLVSDVSIVDRAQIERSGALGLADLLGRLPGVEFQRNGGPGGTTGVFVRGGESRFTAVYIDGVRVDSQATGGASWDSIPLGQVDRIEVLRGPAAAVYGSDAISGVVQIFTKRGENGFAPFFGVAAGTYATRKVEAGFSGAASGFDYSLGLVDEQSDGYNARTLASQNPDLDGYRSRSANVKLGWDLNKTHRLDASYLVNDMNAQYDSFGLATDERSQRDFRTLGLGWQAQWTAAWSTRLSFSESRDRYETTPSPYLTTTTLRSYLLHNEVRQQAHLFTADLERKEDHLENDPINQGRSQNGLALGYGYNKLQHSVQFNVRGDKDSEFGSKSTASAAYGYALTPQWRATGSVATAYRAPTLYQRFSAYGLAALKPESSENAELGLRFTQGASSFGAVVFRNDLTNLITFAAAGPCASAFGCYANTAQATYEGVTLTASHLWGEVNLSASLDLQDPRDQTTGKLLRRRARQHGMLMAATHVGKWTVNAEVQLTGERYEDAANTRTLAGYSLLNLSASTQLAKDWTLVARADNLADKSYTLADTYATAGRSLYLGVKWAPR
jgi:vitamin B12 transporter